jgi:hypothetical protein
MEKGPLLIYDDYCPLCSWYSGLFIKFRFLSPGARVAFSGASTELLSSIDTVRAHDEIPFHDPASGKTWYGIDALLEIISRKCGIIKKLGHFPPVYFLLKKFYKLISYNRKVIVAKKCGEGVYDCSPAFHPGYRLSFMILFLLFNSLMLYPIHRFIFSSLSFYTLTFAQLQSAHFMLVCINCMLGVSMGKKKAIEYLGQINLVALQAVLLVLLSWVILQWIPLLSWMFLPLYFLLLIIWLTKEYFRRMRFASIFISHSYAVYVNILSIALFILYLVY